MGSPGLSVSAEGGSGGSGYSPGFQAWSSVLQASLTDDPRHISTLDLLPSDLSLKLEGLF